MPWLYDTKTGDVEHQNEAEYLLDGPGNALGAGLVNLGIPDSDTSAQAVAAANKYAAAHHTTPPTTSSAAANANAEKTLANDVPGVSSVTGFLGGLTSANLWIRVAKVTAGGIIILIAVSKLTGAGSVVSKIPVPIPV
jgi:hypothetical protein